MHQFNKFKGTKGFVWLWERGLRLGNMRNQEIVERRVKILGFWKEHGEKATTDAFGISKRTLYRWKSALERTGGRIDALDPKSTAPKKRRQRTYRQGLCDRIVTLRTAHPRLGKKKLAPILRTEGFTVSESYCGRVITHLKTRGLLPSGRKISYYAKSGRHIEQNPIRRTKKRRKEKRGLEIDTVIRFIDGVKRYILTAVDVERKFAFAGAYTTHSSATAADFLTKLMTVAPFPIGEIQTDNGSEFAYHFHDACEKLHIIHYNTYPRSPKMNACIERFNRTVWEDFIMWHRVLLRDDLAAFNDKLIDWLLWYNTERPHESLGMLSPMRYIVETLSEEECQMWWTRTKV